MIERILPDMYRVEIPLPRNPLKALNSYVIKSPDRCYFIDTGMNRKECRQAMDEAVQELDIDLSRTDFFITHLHADHEGQARELATPTSVIYMSEDEAAIIINNRNDKRWQMLEEFFISHGAPEDEARAALQNHPGRIYSSYKPVKYHYVANNDVLQFGSYNFTCIETPGHTPHHMCLYDADKKILIAGDHILIDITPNITHWPEMDNALKKYLNSLDSIDKL
jgi:glyoxylase-like metal-dependent hydrolase (beta-lactamase superfamily II)